MPDKDLESIQEARDLADTALAAFRKFELFTEDQVERILAEISKVAVSNAEALARLAVEETGYGTVEHKTLKNLFCAQDVYKAIRSMKTIGIVSEDKEKKIFEVASPIGVIARSEERRVGKEWRWRGAWECEEESMGGAMSGGNV